MFFRRKQKDKLRIEALENNIKQIIENKRQIDMLKGHLHIIQGKETLRYDLPDYEESDLTKIYDWFMKLLKVLGYEFVYQKEDWIIKKKDKKWKK